VIVADTGAIVALLDADDSHHEEMVELFDEADGRWVLPWAILPEVDYLVRKYVGAKAQRAFLADVASGAFSVEWGNPDDAVRAHQLCVRYPKLDLGLVDGAVIAVAERLRARAIATLDIRDFGPIKIIGEPKLIPRDR
jgi:predicted nucleic acid-binding protein